MRTIAIASVVLVAVTAGVSQKAIEAPRPAGFARKAGLVERVACASAKNCAALGVSLYSELGGKWKASTAPVVPHTGGLNLRSLDCPAAGRCEAIALAGINHVVHLTENGRHWNAGEIALPADAAPVDPPRGPSPLLNSISCASAGNCVAVGSYLGNRMTHPLLVTESGGKWGAGVEPQLPANADTTPTPDQPDVGGGIYLVSCPAAGDCTAVGWYTNKTAGHSIYPWVLTEHGGTWSSGRDALLPPDASVQGELDKGASPLFGFTGLSCPSAGNCTAVGGYEDKNGAEQGLILTERDGVWSRGVTAPLPPKAVPNSEPNEFNSPLPSVSCAAPDDCAAVGWYVFGGAKRGLLLTERGGTWKTSTLSLPAKTKAPGGMYLTSVSCASRGNCVAVAHYRWKGATHALIVRERGGTWQRAVNAALPKNASTKPHTFLNSVTCPSASACTVGGYYADRSGKTQGLLLSLRLG
ncbi:MAG TPA: hypothetical protein VGH46_10970 [Gaiellaceae bacterium]